MKIALVVQVVLGAALLCGCPGSPASDPSGGGNCTSGQNCSSTGEMSGSGGNGNTGGSGAAGSGGMTNSGAGGSNTGGASNGGSGGAGGAGNGSGGAGSGNGGSGGGANVKVCDMMAMDIATQEQTIKACDPEAAPGTQCKQTIQGLCCAIPVNDMNSPEVQAYLQLIKTYQQMGCMASCPPDPCPPTTKVICSPTSGTAGTCTIP